jgi:drug/metabolite transporter superfamily protein YnfA
VGARRLVIAPWFLAHGRITDRVAEYAATQGIPVAEPLGAHALVAATVLDRYDNAPTSAHRLAASDSSKRSRSGGLFVIPGLEWRFLVDEG